MGVFDTFYDDEYNVDNYRDLYRENINSLELPSVFKTEEIYGGEILREDDLIVEDVETIRFISAQCGDDCIHQSNSLLEIHVLMHVLIDILHIVLSETDTSINRFYGTYTESVLKPAKVDYCTWEFFRNNQESKTPAYLDVTKMRLQSSSENQRKTFSDTAIGKCSDAAKQASFINRHNPLYVIFQLGLFIQDIRICNFAQDFSAYLPSALGGGNKAPLFGNVNNIVKFHKAYKGGTYYEFFKLCVQECNEYIGKGRQTRSKFLDDIGTFSTFWQSWLKGQSILEVDWCNQLDDWTQQFCVGRFEKTSKHGRLIARLVKDGVLLTEGQVVNHYQHVRMTGLLTGTENYDDALASLEKERSELHRTHVLKQDDEIFSDEKEALPLTTMWGNELTEEELRFFVDRVCTDRHMNSMIHTERIYTRDVINEIYKRGCMNVGGETLFLEPLLVSDMRDSENLQNNFFTYERDFEKPKLSDLQQQGVDYLMGKIDVFPRFLIEDDITIEELKELNEGFYPAIITDDVKMCERISRSKNIPVQRIPMKLYIKALYFSNNIIMENELYPGIPWQILDPDEGSLESGILKYTRDGQLLRGERKLRFQLGDRWDTLLVPETDTYKSDKERLQEGFPKNFVIGLDTLETTWKRGKKVQTEFSR